MRASARFYRILSLVTALFVTGSAAAQLTVATFADPATSAATPLFTLSGSSLSGGWGAAGLTLLTPITGGTYPNATFTMTPVTVGAGGVTTAGTIQFKDAASSLIFQIDFGSALLYSPFGFGASELIGQSVVFSGPIITFPLSQRQFAFSFANQVTTPTGFTWTAAFTSSAVPEPNTLLLLGPGLIGLLRRR